MKAPSPAFSVYPKDIFSDEHCVAMTHEEFGAYMRLLLHAWLEGSIPADHVRLARILKVNHRKFAKVWPALEPCFEERGGRLYQQRLEKERSKQQERSERGVENGRKGGRPIKSTRQETQRKAKAKAKSKPKESFPSPSSSSSPTTKDPVRRAAPSRPSWSSEACDDWTARYGAGSVGSQGGRIAAGLKPLIEANGWDVVRPAWQRYLHETTHPSPSAQDFAAHFADWLPGGRGSGRARAPTQRPEQFSGLKKWAERRNGSAERDLHDGDRDAGVGVPGEPGRGTDRSLESGRGAPDGRAVHGGGEARDSKH